MENQMGNKKQLNQVKQVKQVSRLVFTLKPTKVKPSGKLYSRKSKNLPGNLFTLLFPNQHTLHRS